MVRHPASARRDGSLLWPVLLVVPPILILSVVALYSLRQARATAEIDARRNAAPLARDLAREWGARAASELGALVASACSSEGLEAQRSPEDGATPLCGLVLDGRIRVPFDYPDVPALPAWLLDLTPAQVRAWRQIADASPEADPAGLRRTAMSLDGAPAPVRMNAEWIVLRAEARRNATRGTIARLVELARRSDDVPGESGTPLADLALLTALRRLPVGSLSDDLLRDLRQHVVGSPSLLTRALVDEAVRAAPDNKIVAGLKARLAANERTVALLRRVSLDRAGPRVVRLDSDAGTWIVFVHPLTASDTGPAVLPRTAFHVTLVPVPLVERAFRAAAAAGNEVPSYASAAIRLADWTWRTGGSRVASAASVELATAPGQMDLPLLAPSDTVTAFAGELVRIARNVTLSQEAPGGAVRLNAVPGGHPFTLVLELADRDRLYAGYRRQWWLTVGLVIAAAVAALGGLAAAWRAFERQRRLAEMEANFVAGVSHELRAPIASVRLMSESLERGTVQTEERRQEYLHVIARECGRLSSLVENVLDFSRIDRGRREYSFEATELAALVRDTVDAMRGYADERGVNLVAAADPGASDAATPLVDRAALQQALVNLVDNAIKHSPAGADVSVGTEIVQAARDGAYASRAPAAVRLFVEDHGPGIPPEEHERIFEPFYRRGSELRRETRGVGIGLSIVKHVAEAHGGRVIVRSAPGAGSRFTIEIPYERGALP